jgi:tRNA threonylcarbamoyladenosine biosynthesis protein TsaE
MKPVAPEKLIEIDLADVGKTALAAGILARLVRPGDVLALWGDLGAGKTTFARGFMAALLPQADAVPSPTFTLVQTYPVTIAGNAVDIWHFDLYRLKHAEEAYEIGIEEAFASGVSLIEWPDRLGSLLPRRRLDVTLAPGESADSRRLILAGLGEWRVRLAEAEDLLRGVAGK